MNYRTGELRIWGFYETEAPCGCAATVTWCDELRSAQGIAKAYCSKHIDFCGSIHNFNFDTFTPNIHLTMG